MVRYNTYIHWVLMVNPRKLKYFDELSLQSRST
jgi:hypothetical protein